MNSKKHITVIAKPTHDCNLRCKYCYIDDEAENGRMNSSLLEESIKKVSDFSDVSSWIWHGGEPLIMGVDFYKEVKSIQDFYRKKGKIFFNGVQTNGTMISDRFLDFVEESEDFGIGMSLDGPRDINNKTRIFGSGKGAFDQIMRGINKVKDRFGGVGAIAVINSNNINEVDKMYDFFKDNKINAKFNPLIKSGRFNYNLDLEISPIQYGDFLKKMWNKYSLDSIKTNSVPIKIEPFFQIIGNLATGVALGCNYSGKCREGFVSIGPNGDTYPCGRFDGIKEFNMGNIKESSLEKIMNGTVNTKLKTRTLGVSECGECEIKPTCNSGCMHNAYLDGDIMKKDPYCESYKSLSTMIYKELNKENIKILK